MGSKYLVGLALMVIGTFGGVVLASLSKRIRDVFFVLMILLAPMTERFDINFLSRDWYRGTTRGIEISMVDILAISLLFSSVLFPRRGESRFFWPASLGLMLLFFLYCCFNVGISDPRLFGIFELSKMVRGITIFLAVAFFVRSPREVKLLILTLALIVCYEGAQAFRQRYVFGMYRVPGTVGDANSLSVFFCSTAPLFVAAIESKIPIMLKLLCAMAIALACVGVVLTISRAGLVIIALVLVGATLLTMSWRITAGKLIGFCLVVLSVGIVGGKSWKTISARFTEVSLTEEYQNNRNMGRGYYFRVAKAIVGDRPCGVGLNNWSYWVTQKYGPLMGYKFVKYKGTDIVPPEEIPEGSNVDVAQAAPAHSLLALTAGELGLPGLALFMLLTMRWFQMEASFLWKRSPDPMKRIGVGIFFCLCGLFLQSMTEWVFRQSSIYYVAHILLGVLASLYYVKQKEKRAQIAEMAEEPEPELEPDEPEVLAEPAAASGH